MEHPTPEERAEMAVNINRDLATARRLLSAFNARDHAVIAQITEEYVAAGRGVMVTNAVLAQALEFAEKAFGPDELQTVLDQLAMNQIEIAERVERAWRDGQEPPV